MHSVFTTAELFLTNQVQMPPHTQMDPLAVESIAVTEKVGTVLDVKKNSYLMVALESLTINLSQKEVDPAS